MISNKYISKITMVLMSAVLILCILAIVFFDKIEPYVATAGYSLEYESAIFDTGSIIDINIVMDESKWNEMLKNATQEIYRECDVEINGSTFYQVGIRPKGNTSLSSIARDPDNNRYSFKLEFDQFVDGQTCFGLDKLILNNSYADTTNMKETIVYDMFQFLDADSSLYNYAKISVNNEYWGTYLALEAVEDSFMFRNYGIKDGNLYKPDSMNFKNGNNAKKSSGNNFPAMPEGGFKMPEGGFRMPEGEFKMPEGGFRMPGEGMESAKIKSSAETNEKSDGSSSNAQNTRGFAGGNNRMQRRGMPGMMGGGSNLNYTDDNTSSYSTIWNGQVNNTSEADHKRIVKALKNIHSQNNIEDYIDVDQILKYMAVHNFSVNEDSLSGSMAHNYYLYESDGKISILPWDYNLALGGMHSKDATSVINGPIDDKWRGTQLFDFVFENEEYKARYHKYYEKLVNEYLYGGEFEKTYNRIRTQIDPLAKTDPNSMYSYDEYIKGVEVLYDVIMLRAQSIKGQLDGTIPSTSEDQAADASALIDASHIDISDLGKFNMGGFGGNRQMARDNFDANKTSESQNNTKNNE